MKPRHRRFAWIGAGVALLAGAIGLVLNAFQQNLVFFLSPTEVVAEHRAPQGRPFRIGGLVTTPANVPVAGALVTLVNIGLTTTTGPDGTYVLGSMPAGTYTLRVQSGATIKNVSITIPATAGKNYNVQL